MKLNPPHRSPALPHRGPHHHLSCCSPARRRCSPSGMAGAAGAGIAGTAVSPVLVFCNVTNKIRKRTDTTVAFTQEYSRVSYSLRNVSTLSTGSGSSKDTHTGVGEIGWT